MRISSITNSYGTVDLGKCYEKKYNIVTPLSVNGVMYYAKIMQLLTSIL